MYDIPDLVRRGILRPDEELLAHEIQHKHGLATFAVFIHAREQQQRASAAAVQAKVNKQLGLSGETFARYAGDSPLQIFALTKASASVQDEINRQLRVSPAVFAKYGY